MFYVFYLRIREHERSRGEKYIEFFLVATNLWALSLIGFLFVTASLLVIGTSLDIIVLEFLIDDLSVGAPMMFIGPIPTALLFYYQCVYKGQYKNYKHKYPEATIDNIRKLDQSYMLYPVVFSFFYFCISIWLTFETGRGV